MVVIACPIPSCTYQTTDEEPTVVSALLNIHALSHAQATAPSKGPKLNRPQIDIGVDQETWNAFIRRWEAFKIGSNINDTVAPTQLFQCASEALGDLLLKVDPSITSRSVATVLDAMQKLAVIPTAKGVLRAELMQLKQGADENFRTFAARVKGKAETCGTVPSECQCGIMVMADYTEEAIRDVLLAGIMDMDIRRDALGATDIQEAPVNEVIAFVEGREMARNATPMSSLSAVSSFKQSKTSHYKPHPSVSSSRTKTAACPDCGQQFHPFKQKDGVWNTATQSVP